jgi:superfamily II DNA/RNA helicase
MYRFKHLNKGVYITYMNNNKNKEKTKHTDEYYQNIDYDNFDDFLCEHHRGDLMRGVYDYKFERPSPIQAKSIEVISHGRDLIAQAQSGSGKTGAFVIGGLTLIDPKLNHPQILIMANTIELAGQIYSVAKEISKHLNIKISLCTGGGKNNGENNRTRNLVVNNLSEAESSHFIVCTPGRMVDLIQRDKRKKNRKGILDNLKSLIIDESDVLLGENFLDQTQFILKCVPQKSQICIFSATYPDEVLQHTTSFMSDPVRILVDRENVNVEMIKNYFVNAQEEIYKYAIIVELYKRVSVCQSVIFVNTIRKAEELANNLRKDGHSVGVIHSDLDGIERTEMLQKFRLTQIRTLIATDVISRGIDVQQVGLVINYDVPRGDSEKYIHRVGRSGRFGKKGVAITLITESMYDEKNMESIEKEYNIDFMSLPSIEEINEFLTGTNGYTYKEECCYESEGECNNEESESDNEEK